MQTKKEERYAHSVNVPLFCMVSIIRFRDLYATK